MDIIALIGSILLAICSLPLAWEALRYPDSAKEINGAFLHCWALGEILTTTYVVYQGYWVLLINYAVNLAGLSVVYWQRWRRNTHEQHTRPLPLRDTEADAGSAPGDPS